MSISDSVSALSGFDYRLRADQITGLSTGSAVSSWPDASPAGNAATQATGANQPTWQAAALGGKPTVRFDGTSSYLASNASTKTTTMTVIVVFSGTWSSNLTYFRGGPSYWTPSLGLDTSGHPTVFFNGVQGLGTASAAISASTPVVIAFTYDAVNGPYAFRINGTAVGTGSSVQASALSNATTTFIGATGVSGSPSAGTYLNGDIAEIMVFNRVLSPSELATVDSYVQDFYGITVSDYTSGTPALTNTIAPAVTPTSSVTTGTVLTTTNGTWSATPDSYTYQWKRAGVAISGATASTYTVVSGDLSNAITCTVTAVKATYTSGSATSNSVTPTSSTTVPGAPTGLTATAGNTQAALSWTAPASNGGAAITDYTVQYRTTAGPGAWTTFTHAASTATTQTVTGLTNGTGYDFQVAAVNSVGTGTYSGTASATPTTGATTTTIAPNDTNIIYSPYTWAVTASNARSNNSGAYLRARISGSATSITANFDQTNSNSSPQLEIQVDDQPAYTTVVGSGVSTLPIAIPGTNMWTDHTIRITVTGFSNYGSRWGTQPVASVNFTGFTVGPATVTTGLTRRRPYNILCMGDSITEGVDTLGTGNDKMDARYSWASLLGPLIGAEVGVVGFSGLAMLSGIGDVPAFPSSYNLLWTGQARSFTSPAQPDLVIINMGTNDSGDITSAATTVLNGILAATTTTKIVILQQWSGTTHKTQWQAAAAASTAPSRVTYLDTSGWMTASGNPSDGTHPAGWLNVTDLAPRIAAQLTPLLTGTITPKRYVNVGGTAKPIG